MRECRVEGDTTTNIFYHDCCESLDAAEAENARLREDIEEMLLMWQTAYGIQCGNEDDEAETGDEMHAFMSRNQEAQDFLNDALFNLHASLEEKP